MTKEKFKKAIDVIGLPRLIVFCFFMAIVATAAVNGIDVASYLSSTLKYFGMWGILVLAMIPSIKCGIGPNFGVSLGIVCGLLGSLLAWAVLGRRTRIMTQQLDSATMPEFFGKRFKSDRLKLCASAIIFLFLIPYTASLYNGLSSLFNNVTFISSIEYIISLLNIFYCFIHKFFNLL